MGAKQSKDNLENEFVFENPLLHTETFELPQKHTENNNEVPNESKIDSNADDNNNENINPLPNIDNIDSDDIDLESNIKDEDRAEFTLEKKEKNNNDANDNANKEANEVKEIPKNKKKKYTEEPLPEPDDTYKPLELFKPDEILSPETVENIIEEHVKEELYCIQHNYKIKNFKRDKLLERTIGIIKYGNSNFNYKDINDKYRKSQKKVLECMSNNSECSLSERDIACYQEFEEFKDNIRMIYKKYYNA